jgi:hypothetical protein
MSAQPPGRTAASRCASAVSWSEMCSITALACTKSKPASSGAPLKMS